ncbi:type II toxin-antitoxin system RelE/ParE family toxin [Endozoicomonas sp. ONNA2]|uniref:type II toxin-antitoxin system RelE/ParE family toxin n=1 Tax=Endozoicomonas sp. ONNA2 TaxID=2828741 RepID=UPI0021476F57|nr:type II toxin-antitoxin system RelE/ParE family toxin [Endozoicomonas sp. ONNA2]
MQTIVELSIYQKRAIDLLDQEERREIIDYLASNPDAGDIMQGTGGIRKLRWKRGGSGKSGGVRVIYFYRNMNMPLFLLTLYAKGEQDNLSKAERNNWKKMIEQLVHHYGE